MSVEAGVDSGLHQGESCSHYRKDLSHLSRRLKETRTNKYDAGNASNVTVRTRNLKVSQVRKTLN